MKLFIILSIQKHLKMKTIQMNHLTRLKFSNYFSQTHILVKEFYIIHQLWTTCENLHLKVHQTHSVATHILIE